MRDLLTHELTTVTRLSDGTWGYGASRGIAMSANGRYVSFESSAKNLLAPPVETDSTQVWRFDRARGALELASIGSMGPLDGETGHWTSLSADGRSLAFATDDSQFIAYDTNSWGKVLVRTYGSNVAGDVNEDGATDAFDLAALFSAWGTTDAAADLDGDGIVGASDLGILLGGWTGS